MKNIQQSLVASLAALALMSLPACASFDFFTTNPSPLPIEAVDAVPRSSFSTRAFETEHNLFVTGHMQKPGGIHIPAPAHVDVQLIGKDGRVLAEEQIGIDPVHPRSTRALTGRHPFVASFPIEQARKSAKIRVRYHLESHGA